MRGQEWVIGSHIVRNIERRRRVGAKALCLVDAIALMMQGSPVVLVVIKATVLLLLLAAGGATRMRSRAANTARRRFRWLEVCRMAQLCHLNWSYLYRTLGCSVTLIRTPTRGLPIIFVVL